MEPDNIILYDDVYTTDTVDISSITTSTSGYTDYNVDWDMIEIKDTKNRISLRNSGTIPLDIWAKIYNNNKLEDDLF